MPNMGQLGPENCRAYVFFAWCFFFFFVLFCFVLFSPFFFLCFFPLFFLSFLFFFYSSPDLNLHLYSILHDFSFKNTKFSASERAHPLRHPLCVQACNWRWRSTKSSPNVEDGCTALCSFSVLAVVKCCKQSFIAMVFFFFLFLYINSRLFYLSLWRMKINLFTKFWGKLLTNKKKCIHMMEFIYTLMPQDLLKMI